MTGYGRGLAERGGHRVVVEIRSVNHRFLDLKLRGAGLEPALEDRISSRVRAKITRGALTVTIRLDQASVGPTMRIDFAAARRVHAELRELADSLHSKAEIGIDLVCAQPGVLLVVESEHGEVALGEVALEAVDGALEELTGMRAAEGQVLARDLAGRLERLVSLTGTVERHAASAPAEAQRRLSERLTRLLKSSAVAVDEQRLAQEVAVLADRLDVTEELVRARSHIEQVRDLIAGKADAGSDGERGIGRRLDFLVQELGREYNTVASKAQSAEIARIVVDAKAELEKIREQVQNIE